MKTVSASEARDHLGRYLQEATSGTTITIARRGRPIAQLVPPERHGRPDPAAAVEAIREFSERAKISLGGLTIRELIEEGRRY